ncbi:MAG: 50S ribosomal protein L35, partial [Alphaproteobacteria bacterium]|nr:50S ribosomal protein L35 [Alphaproteobacteria bacterium]
MPKLKTHSGAKKRFRVTGNGKVKCGASHRRHFMRRRSQNMKRTARQGLILFKTDG